MFAVVEFLSTDEENTNNEIAIVPKCWIHKNGRKCHWPEKIPPKTTFEDFVRQIKPAKSSWPSYKIYKIHANTETYDSAEEELNELLRENRLETEESAATSKSLTRKTHRHVADENVTETVDFVSASHESTVSVSDLSLANTLTITNSDNISSGSSSVFCSKFEDEMIKKMSKVETHVEQHTAILNELVRFIRGASCSKNEISKPEGVPHFPLKDLNEFQQFDLSLSTNENLSQYMVTRMAAVGGVEVDSSVRCIMRFLLHDEVARHYNWKGRDKISFEQTNIMPLIYEAVKRIYASQDGTDFIVNKTVKDWLKYANARIASKSKPKKFN